jgi:hypothetical protein
MFQVMALTGYSNEKARVLKYHFAPVPTTLGDNLTCGQGHVQRKTSISV